jgi:hypothetical protein
LVALAGVERAIQYGAQSRPVRRKWARAAADSVVATEWHSRNGGLLTLRRFAPSGADIERRSNDMTTDNTKSHRPTAGELATELRRRRQGIVRVQGIRRLMAAAYAIVADDLDERDQQQRARRITDATTP